MENVKGEASSHENGTDQATASADPARAAKSVISINRDNVTIISTGKDGKNCKPAKVTTTPLRPGQDPSLTGASNVVSARIKDTQFVSALTSQFQANGSLSVPSRSAPTSSTSSSRASACHSRSSSSSSGIGEDLTSKLSSMLLQQQQQQQQKQQQQQQQQVEGSQKNGSTGVEGQHVSEDAPSCSSGSSDLVNGASSGGGGSGTSSPDFPPTPPPSAIVRSISEQPQLRKVDASYTPRPSSYSTQNSSAAGNPGSPQVHNKHDLMAALTAVVTSGSPVAGLRKTRGPGRGGGVTEVFTSKKSTGNSSTGSTAAAPQQKDN